MTRSLPRRLLSAGLVLLVCWGAAGWWPMLSANAPAWTRWLPLPMAAAAAAVWWLAPARRVRPLQRAWMALLSLIVWAGFARDMAPLRETRHIDGWQLRMTQWHLADRLTIDQALAAIQPDHPHVVVLTGYRRSDRTSNDLRRRLRLHHSVVQDEIILLSRYPVVKLPPPALPETRALHAYIQAPRGVRIPVLAVAMNHPTREGIVALAKFLDENRPNGPYLLAGSLGMNRTDARLATLRSLMRPAFEVGGFGWPYSHCAPVPLFSHENLWVSPGWAVQRSAFRVGPDSPYLRHMTTLSVAQGS